MRLALTLSALLVAAVACSSEVTISGGDGGSGAATGTASGGAAAGGADASSGTASGGGGAPSCPETTMPGACSLAYQDCPSGQECVVEGVVASAHSVCADPVPGLDLGVGEICSQESDCGFGLTCIDDRCREFCCEGDFTTCQGGACNISVDFGGGNFASVCTVETPCDIFQPGTCGATGDCHIQDGAPNCMPPSAGQVPEGSPCQYLNDCGDGQHCFQNICRYYCDINSSEAAGYGGCPPSQTCSITMQLPPSISICQP